MSDTIVFKIAPEGFSPSMELFALGKITEGCESIYKNKEMYLQSIPALENMLNGMGYDFMGKNDLKSALQVLELNTKLFPNSSNVFDSYGEALRKNGDTKSAINNYRQSIILNPNNANGKRALKEMDAEM